MVCRSTLDTQQNQPTFLWFGSVISVFQLQGFKREWAPFVLTPDFVYVMGGEVCLHNLML